MNTGKTALGTCGFARSLGSRLKRTIELTKKILLRKLGFGCLAYNIALELVWVPSWANPPDAPSRSKPLESWYASLPKLPSTPTAVLASAPALSELDLLREPLSVAAHTKGEHVRELKSSGAFGCLKTKLVHVEDAPHVKQQASSQSVGASKDPWRASFGEHAKEVWERNWMNLEMQTLLLNTYLPKIDSNDTEGIS